MPLLKKLLLLTIVVIVYFFGIRNLRSLVHDFHLGSVLPTSSGLIDGDTSLSFYSQSSVSYTFYYNSDSSYTWVYKIPYGAFFLFSLLGLILIDAKRVDYLILIGIHFTSGLISFLFLLVGINFYHYLLIVPDLLSRYLVPLFSLGLVGFAYLKKDGKLG
ncbi:MAG: hypothetical protein ED557_04525 [Balneola sp.]|nr:MAG: hypothetical protein ED557_04525 [Balneola sp.]